MWNNCAIVAMYRTDETVAVLQKQMDVFAARLDTVFLVLNGLTKLLPAASVERPPTSARQPPHTPPERPPNPTRRPPRAPAPSELPAADSNREAARDFHCPFHMCDWSFKKCSAASGVHHMQFCHCRPVDYHFQVPFHIVTTCICLQH
jgi:hypothetical protein